MFRYSTAPAQFLTLSISTPLRPAPVVLPRACEYKYINNQNNLPGNNESELGKLAAIAESLGWWGNCAKQLAAAIKDRGIAYVRQAVEYCASLTRKNPPDENDERGGLLRWGLFKGLLKFPAKRLQTVDSSKPAEVAQADPVEHAFKLARSGQISDAVATISRAVQAIDMPRLRKLCQEVQASAISAQLGDFRHAVANLQ